MNRLELKRKARESLNNKYGDAILIYLILCFCGGFSGFFTNIGLFLESPAFGLLGLLLSAVLNGAFTFGYISFYLKLSRQKEVHFQELFSKTYLLIPYFIATILIGLFTFLWTLLLIIPGIIAAISYSQTLWIMADQEEISPLAAIRKSKQMMQGHKLDYFILNLSFIGWHLLSLLTCGMLNFWLIPYINATQAQFYNKLLEENN